MKRMELVDFELAFKQAASAHKKVGWVSVFNKTIIHFYKSFNFKAKAFSFCLFYCPACPPGLRAGITIREFLNNKATRIL